MTAELAISMLLIVAVVVAVSGIVYIAFLLTHDKRVSSQLTREPDEAALLKSYEDELRTLEIKARTGNYNGADSERYARLIYRRNALLKKAQVEHLAMA